MIYFFQYTGKRTNRQTKLEGLRVGAGNVGVYRGYKADHAILVPCVLIFRFASRIMSVNRYVMYLRLLHSLSIDTNSPVLDAGNYIIDFRRMHLMHVDPQWGPTLHCSTSQLLLFRRSIQKPRYSDHSIPCSHTPSPSSHSITFGTSRSYSSHSSFQSPSRYSHVSEISRSDRIRNAGCSRCS